jgi:hypothetical protein
VLGLPGDDFWRVIGDAEETLVDAEVAEAKLAWALANISEPSCGKRGMANSL